MKPAAERGNKISGEELLGARLIKVETGSSNLYASLFRKTLFDLGITPAMWDQLMTIWLDDPRNKVKPEHRARGAARRYLNSQLRQSQMSLYVFTKAVRFLSPMGADLEMKLSLRWPNGRSTDHTTRRLNFLF